MSKTAVMYHQFEIQQFNVKPKTH